MDVDSKISEIETKVSDNNRILRKLLAHQRYLTLISVLKWVLIVGTALGAYYFLQPYIDQILLIYKDLGPILNPVGNFLNGN